MNVKYVQIGDVILKQVKNGKPLLVCPYCRSSNIRRKMDIHYCIDCGLGFKNPLKIILESEKPEGDT